MRTFCRCRLIKFFTHVIYEYLIVLEAVIFFFFCPLSDRYKIDVELEITIRTLPSPKMLKLNPEQLK